MNGKVLWLHFDEGSEKRTCDGLYCDLIQTNTLLDGEQISELRTKYSHFIFSQQTSAAEAVTEEKELSLISDHVNISGFNPLRGQNREDLGPRFPDMSHAYDSSEERSAALGLDGERTLVYAGSSDFGPRADLLVWQTILAGHQGIRPVGVLLRDGVVLKRKFEMINQEKQDAS